MREPARSGCPITMAVEAFGDRWSLLVLRDVMFGNRRHFRELLAGPEEKIASNILADRLRRLTGAGLLTRDNARPGQRATYSLTEAAIQLIPVPTQLGARGIRHRTTTPRLRVRAELLASGGPQVQAQFTDELREIHLGHPARQPHVPGRPNAWPVPMPACHRTKQPADGTPADSSRRRRHFKPPRQRGHDSSTHPAPPGRLT